MIDITKEQPFTPDIVTPPGETLKEILEGSGMSQVELAGRAGLDKKTINLIAQGKAPVTPETALAFERVLGLPARFWMALETQYAEQQAREHARQRQAKFQDWARKFPYAEMSKRGWLAPARRAEQKVEELLSFFRVAEPDSWASIYGELKPCYRKSAQVKEKCHAISAWLRAGEVAAEKMKTAAEYDEAAFKKSLLKIRDLTLVDDPNEFRPKLERLCAEAGVIFVMVPELPGLGVSGVMRWLNRRPMIQQCLRFRTNDQFWFTFFHEARHVQQNHRKTIFVEGDQIDPENAKLEEDANRSAGEFLIPPADYAAFRSSHPHPKSQQIREFARAIRVHPAIVVGRLQRDRIIDWSHPAKNLKISYVWV